MSKRSCTHVYLFLFGILVSCGDQNFFQAVEQPSVSEMALAAMEKGDPAKAVKLLEDAGAGQNDNYEWTSILASAYAEDAGLVFIDLVLSLATEGDGAQESNNALLKLWPHLPEASASNLEKLGRAQALLASIPSDHKIIADHFKMAIFSTCLASLRLRALDLSGDGELGIEELAALDEETAVALLEDILQATMSAASFGSLLGEGSGDAAESIQQVYSEIEAQPGATQAEKIQSYIDASGS